MRFKFINSINNNKIKVITKEVKVYQIKELCLINLCVYKISIWNKI